MLPGPNGAPVADQPASPVDPKVVVRTGAYRRLLALAAVLGFFVSLAAWAFLTLVPWIQDRVYITVPHALGFSEAPWWWPLPVLAIAGVISAVILIEAAGLGGPTLPLIVLPALLASGIGSLVYIGMADLTGLSTSAYAIRPLELSTMPQLTVVDFCWTLAVASVAAIATYGIVWLARETEL